MDDVLPPPRTDEPRTDPRPAAVLRPLTALERRRLQRQYEQALQLMQQPEHDRQEPHRLLAECVSEDPGNAVYVGALLQNLVDQPQAGWSPRQLWGGGPRAALAKAAGHQDWVQVLLLGPAALLNNPRDAATLGLLARACEAVEAPQAAALYLQRALELAPEDVELNRQAAHQLARQGRFEEAIGHWQRVEQADPRDDEAPRMISALTLEKVRQPDTPGDGRGGNPTAERLLSPPAVLPADPTAAEPAGREARAVVLTPRQRLERAIIDNPEDESNYLKLAELLIGEQRLFDAQQTLSKALTVSRDLRIVERLEDVNMLRAQQQIEIARQRADEERTTQALDLIDKLIEEARRLELQVFRARSDRYPQNKTLRFELGLRLKRLGNVREALEPLQAGLEVPEHRAAASLEIGEILQRYKQFPKALQCYRQAAQLAAGDPGKEAERRNALYRAGVLAEAMGLYDSAQGYLAELVRIAPDFKDARSRLDKLNEIGKDL